MIIKELFLIKDKINIFDGFDVDVEILTDDKYIGIEKIDEFKEMDKIDFLKKAIRITNVIEYDDYIIMYIKSDKKGFMRANGAFKKIKKVGINKDDNLDTKIKKLIKNKDKIEFFWFNNLKINTTTF